MTLKNTIKRILNEESKPPIEIRRRLNIDDNYISVFLKDSIIRYFKKENTKEENIEKVINKMSEGIIWDSGLGDESPTITTNLFFLLKIFIRQKYGKFINSYYDNTFIEDDNETYCFIKEKRLGDPLSGGFTDCVKGWFLFLMKYGYRFTDVDWNEIKKKLNKEKRILIKKPLENHLYHYYISINKK